MSGFFRRRTHYDNDNYSSYKNYNDGSDVDNSSSRISSKKNRRLFWILSPFLVFFSLNIAFRTPIPTKTPTYETSHSDAKLVVSSSKILESSQSDICWHIPVPSVRFHPKPFMEHGPGLPYLHLYEHQLKKKRRLLKVRFVLYNWTTACQPIYYHIHKNGGTAMNVKNHQDHHPSIAVDSFYTPREQELGQEAFHKEALKVMNRVQNQTQQQPQQEQEVDTMPIFTFLRDPVPRFLSSIGQALRLGRLHPCNLRSNGTIELVLCVLAKINKTQSFLDEHLIPQAFELYMGMMGLDLGVTVMDLPHLSTALEGLFGPSFLESHSAVRRKSPTLVQGFNLSQALLPPTVIFQICQLYRVDVLLLQMTQVSTTICN